MAERPSLGPAPRLGLMLFGLSLGLLLIGAQVLGLCGGGHPPAPPASPDGARPERPAADAPGATPETGNRYAHITRRSPDPSAVPELIPGKNGVVSPRGFIGEDVPLPKPPGLYRVLGLGDSISMYLHLEGQNHLARLSKALPDLTARPSDLLNLAIAGLDIPQSVQRFEHLGLAYAPDLVLFQVGPNDLMQAGAQVRALAPATHPQLADADDDLRAQRALRAAIDAGPGRAAFHTDHVATARHWQDVIAALDHLAELSRAHHFRVLLVIFPVLLHLDDYHLAPTHQALADHATALGFDTLDLASDFASLPPADLRIYPDFDPIHPNANGYAHAFAAIEAWLNTHRPWQASPDSR